MRELQQVNLPSGGTAEIVQYFTTGEFDAIEMIQIFDDEKKAEKQDSEKDGVKAANEFSEKTIDLLKLMKQNKVEAKNELLRVGVKKINGQPADAQLISDLRVQDSNFLVKKLKELLIDEQEKKI